MASGNVTVGGNLTVTGTFGLTGNVDINGGTIDGTSIGSSSASTGAFTTLTSSSTTTLNGTTIPASKTLVTLDDIQTLTNKSLTSPTFTGIPIAPTAAADTNTTQVATTAFVEARAVAERTKNATLTGKTLDLTNNTLITTSAQLRAAITDETGSGAAVFGTSPTITSPVINGGATLTADSTELNILDGATVTVTELNKLSGVTSTTAELNKLSGATITTSELNQLHGITTIGVDLVQAASTSAGRTAIAAAPVPTNSGIGEWRNISASGSGVTLYLPATGTWAYLVWLSTAGGADSFNISGVAAGGTAVLGPTTGTLLGFAYRIA